jgi:uncharacterized membrane protein
MNRLLNDVGYLLECMLAFIVITWGFSFFGLYFIPGCFELGGYWLIYPWFICIFDLIVLIYCFYYRYIRKNDNEYY